MTCRMTEAQARAMLGKHYKLEGIKPKAKKPKYKNTKITVDGVTFDSRKEYERYVQLLVLLNTGVIAELSHQVKFELLPSVKFSSEKRAKPALRYIADFVYTDVKTGLQVVEDVKSAITRKLPAYRQKKHLMMAVHGIEIREV